MPTTHEQPAYEAIRDYLQTIETIDTHEHLPPYEDKREQSTDFLRGFLCQYFVRDLVSAGLSGAELDGVVRNTKKPLAERWRVVEPYWNAARHTGYGQLLDIVARDLYSVAEGVNGGTIEALDAAFQKSLQPGWYEEVLKKRCNLRFSLLDSWSTDCDRRFYRPVVRLDGFIAPRNRWDPFAAEQRLESHVTCLDEWLAACERYLDESLAKGAVAIKCGLAYQRSLYFGRATRAQAEEAFDRLLMSAAVDPAAAAHPASWTPLEDFMMHYVLRLANARHLTVQIHTGLHEGNSNRIANSDPSLLNNLFQDYRDVRFDIFHIGFPYQHVLSALAKMFPNVYIDMCWAHIISPPVCVRMLSEWIETVPTNKISAFGGDYGNVDCVYGHLVIARRNVAKALAEKVADGLFGLERAKEIGKMLFHDNPERLFRLEKS